MLIQKNLLKEITSQDIDNVNQARRKAYEWCDSNGGVWSKEQQFLHVIEETGELVDEILKRKNSDLIDLSCEIDELGDLWFTYLTFIDNQDFVIEESEKFAIYRYVIDKIKNINWESLEKNILLRFITEVSRENKIQRKISGRKDNYKYNQLDVKKTKALSLFLLHILTRYYFVNVNYLIDTAINKYESRDKK